MLNIEEKEDSLEKLAATQGKPTKHYLFAPEFNAVVAKCNELEESKADLVAGKVPSSQLPSYVDDVLEFASLDDFPSTGEIGKIYIALDTGFTYRWGGSVYVQIGGGTNKQIFHWHGGNWSTPTLNTYYYIGYSGGAIINQSVNGSPPATTVNEAMNGRNKGLFIAPFNCKIKRVMFKEGGSGSYTGYFALASGLPNYGYTWNLGYLNIVTHLNEPIISAEYHQNKYEFLVTDEIVIPKGYVVAPLMMFTTQAQAGKYGVEISIEIEEVIS